MFVLLSSFILFLGAADCDLSKGLGFDGQLFSVTHLDLREVWLWSDEGFLGLTVNSLREEGSMSVCAGASAVAGAPTLTL